jgi:hypothetical protein
VIGNFLTGLAFKLNMKLYQARPCCAMHTKSIFAIKSPSFDPNATMISTMLPYDCQNADIDEKLAQQTVFLVQSMAFLFNQSRKSIHVNSSK